MTEQHQQQPNERSQLPEEDLTTTVEPQHIVVKRAEHFMESYANYVSLATSLWDMTVMFGRTVTDDLHNPYVEQRLSVTISPQTAKAMVEILWRNVLAYEQRYGTIRYTPIQQSKEEPSG
jgi:hypothetical protein